MPRKGVSRTFHPVLGRQETKLARTVCALSLALAAGGVALAQDEPPPPPPIDRERPAAKSPRLDPTDPKFRGAILGDAFHGKVRGGEMAIYAVGGVGQPVWIKVPGMELRCGSVVVWGDAKRLRGALTPRLAGEGDEKGKADNGGSLILGPIVHAIYAEGNVFLRRSTHTIEAERVMIDFAENRAYMVKAHMRGRMGKLGDGSRPSLSVRADVIRGHAKNRYRAEDPSFTTCTYDRPHTRFTTDWLEVDFEDEYVAFDSAWWPRGW